MNHPASSPSPAKKVDAVRAKRAKVAKYTLLANRVGYLFFALAIATFIIGFAVSAIVIGSVIAGSVLLAPAIVLGYAVKAAERHDRERGL
jgi:hypothetical protein